MTIRTGMMEFEITELKLRLYSRSVYVTRTKSTRVPHHPIHTLREHVVRGF